ncbi:hypothetical protein FNV43_RR12478 [Rhamnella rubrinervis]|uniref:peroxidase n=1 Tax=Rhamnella rubrinervis TaxID=2594499 RepID=A0A8K0H7T1_9ROSA|nr:hypothetical protein FNV43_RR12478 [Rhamnella rubrinervis]
MALGVNLSRQHNAINNHINDLELDNFKFQCSRAAVSTNTQKGAHFSHRIFARVLQQGLVVSTDDVLLETPAVDDAREEDKEDVHRVLDGAADSNSKHKALKSSSTRVKKKDEKEDGSDRFKLRNGREIYWKRSNGFTQELAQLADTAGLMVVGTTYQKLASPNPRTYIGSGKVAEIKSAIHALDVETVIFDDELSPGQLRNLEKAFGGDVRVCDRTALILDIFNQRAATHEAALQVALAQMEYQLPRLTKCGLILSAKQEARLKEWERNKLKWTSVFYLTQIGGLKKELESVRKHRKQYRSRRLSVPVPVVSLVGYTNAGKSTLLNQLTGANVLAEDRLFATLDPTTRRVQMKNGKDFLLTDTVGFIQKLPTALVAAFRATLEEISESSLLVHVVDISHPLAQQQIDAVDKVLSELDVSSIPKLMVWNKVDKVSEPKKIKLEADQRGDVVCVSALNGNGLIDFCDAVQEKLKDSMVWVEALIPFEKGELLSTIHQVGMVERTEYTENGTLVEAHVPLRKAWKSALTLAHPGFNFGWGGHGGGGISGGSFGLFPEFYQFSCPQANDIVLSVLEKAIAKETRMAASLLRLHFHDCFVQGCDASVLLDDSATIASEKRSGPNSNSIRGFEVIDEIKAKLEEECPNTVSCADILALAARGSTVLSGGPNWVLPLGRRDSKSASLSASNNNIPAPNSTLQNLLTSFKRQGLDEVDLVALSGGHTIGMARCATFKQRLYNQNGNNQPDETLERSYYYDLKSVCPRSGGDNNISPLDLASPARFDNTYFKLILLGKGLLTSDEVLLTGNVGNTVSLVKSYAEDENLFSEQFARSMVKMGNINPLTGFNGEVRKNCRRVN